LALIASIVLLLLLIQGAVSLSGGVRFASFIRRSLRSPLGGPTPRASIIAPIKGLDAGTLYNIRKLFSQDYPDYEIIFVIAEPHDPARSAIELAISENPGRHARLLVAGRAACRSQKVNNLLHGAASISRDSEVLVFVDSDAGIGLHWLRALIAALWEPGVGASTGYRWYIPATGGFWSKLVSAWNGSILTTLGDHTRNFAWGGSAAIRKDTFERTQVARHWDKALSDDYVLTRAVQQAGFRIVFVPRCLVLTREDFGLDSALEFTRRQVTITRVYDPHAWWAGMASQSLFVLGFFGGIVWAACRVLAWAIEHGGPDITDSAGASSQPMLGALSLIASVIIIYVLGLLKGRLRLEAATLMLPEAAADLRRMRMVFYLLWPLVSIVFLYDFAASALTRKIMWRGIRYEMRSPTETVVIDQD
jgi:hypothetical protein